MKEKDISPQEGFAIIQKMISESRYKLVEDGFDFMLWGATVVILSLLNYYSYVTDTFSEYSLWIWLGGMFIALIISLLHAMHLYGKKRPVRNMLSKLNAALWLAFGISLVLVFVVGGTLQQNIAPFILIMVGFASFVCSKITLITIMRYASFVFWLGSIVCLFVNPVDTLLVNAICMLLGYIIPGTIIGQRYKKEKDV